MDKTVTMSNVNFELAQYINELYHEINSLVYSDEEGASKEDKFSEHVMEILSEAEETEGIRLCHYEKENKRENIQTKINGYAIEEGLETLDIFITSFKDTDELYRVSKPDFDNLLKWSTSFVNLALKGYLNDIEPSSEAYGLAQLISKYKKDLIRVNIFLLSNGNIPHDPPKNFALKNLENYTINFHVWDIERLHRLSESRNNREPIEINFEDTLNQTIPCLAMPSNNDIYECYLGIVPGSLLSALYKNYGTRLLESNVRAFLQQTGKVNKGIRDTIKNDPHMFLPYNNGLATTAQEVETRVDENGQLLITGVKDFQIVNGGQTTASIFHTEKKFKVDISKVFVQFKLTVIKDEAKKDTTVPFISRYANSQNKVSELDLTSNNAILQRLEELSRTTYSIDSQDSNIQTLWFFERVKGQYREALNKEPTKGKKDAFKFKHPRNQLIIKSQIAKVMNIWEGLPFHVSKGAQKNYNYYIKEVEKKFKKNKPGRVYWQDIVANAILFNNADKLFGRKNQNPIGDTNIKSYTVVYTLSYIHLLTKNRIDLGKIWENQMIPDDFSREIYKGLKFVYEFLNSLDVSLISEAAKSEKTWNLLKEKKNHPIDMEVLKKNLISDSDFKKRYETVDDSIEESKKYEKLQKITSLGLKFWDGLLRYNRQTDILSDYQSTIVASIRKKLKQAGKLTEIEVKKGCEIIEKLIQLGLDFSQVAVLSPLKEADLVDPSIVYNRLFKLSKEDWQRILDLGDQTKVLSFKEISIIKTVITKLKRKEDIDLKRLEITANAMKKLKRFGLKY